MKHRLFIITVILLFLFPLTLQALTLDEEKKYGKEVYFEITKSATLNNDPYLACY